MTSNIVGVAAACALAIFSPMAAEAALVRVDFAGTQTGGSVSLPAGPASIAAHFIYDDAAPNTAAPGEGYVSFQNLTGVFSVSTSAGGVCGGGFGGLGQIAVRNDVTTSVGLRDVASGVGVSLLGCLSATTTTSVRLVVAGPATSWSDVTPSFDKWIDPDLNFLQIVLVGSDGTQPFIFNVTSLSAAPVNVVPLPAAAPLFLIGLAAFWRRRMRTN